jgi:hypothetical protein
VTERTATDVDAATAREMWRLLEPIHALSYFAPESTAALKAAGLRGYWMSYFAGRASPMGAASASIVESTFFNFAPWLVRRALPDAWTFAAPSVVLDARWAGVAAALAPLAAGLPSATVSRSTALLGQAVEQLNCDGRTLAAANAALSPPDDELARFWQLVTTVREHRGDGHVAALVCAGLTGLEAHLTLVGAGVITREVLQGARGFTDKEWQAAQDGLEARGLVDVDGVLTDRGRELRREIESTTDEVALGPWVRLGASRCEELRELVTPLTAAIAEAGAIPVHNPMGLPSR